MKLCIEHSVVLPNCCGIMDVGGFEELYGDYTQSPANTVKGLRKSGTGLFTASFINNKICKEAYEQLCEHHTLLFQSKPYKNNNSQNKVFLCVFKHGKPKKKKEGGPSTWPEPFERTGEKLPRI